ncbi:MAG: RluA family pseudouridine synthase [Butyrivibrio sp.]|nr:RluA family pseudouridine synthase [Butyrivibrio sp.]
MKKYTIRLNEAGQRFDKYLFKLFKEAPVNLLYKQLRCKNITLNGARAKGSEILEAGDEARVFMSDETIAKFMGESAAGRGLGADASFLKVVYEDENIIIANKPSGVLSQKAAPDDISMNEYLISYLTANGMREDELLAFTPAFCNRLDYNTSGLMVGGKSLAGLRGVSEVIRNRSLAKYYLAVVCGCINDSGRIEGWLKKDGRANTVSVGGGELAGGSRIVTEYEPLSYKDGLTLLRLKLVTGKPHQLRAHMASIGHPILGDSKYGDKGLNSQYRVKGQLLHSYEVVFPDMTGTLSYLSGRSFRAEVPKPFGRFF